MKKSAADVVLKAKMIARWENEGGAASRDPGALSPTNRSPRPAAVQPPSDADQAIRPH
jgi:hypothetical protein